MADDRLARIRAAGGGCNHGDKAFLLAQLAAALKELEEARRYLRDHGVWCQQKGLDETERDALEAEVERQKARAKAAEEALADLLDTEPTATETENARLKTEVVRLRAAVEMSEPASEIYRGGRDDFLEELAALRAAIEPTEENADTYARLLAYTPTQHDRDRALAFLVAIAARAKEPTP